MERYMIVENNETNENIMDDESEVEEITDSNIDDDCIESDLESLKYMLPQHPSRLFALIYHSKNIDKIAYGWTLNYQMDENKAILELIQLFVDMAGYQFVSASGFKDPTQLIRHMRYIDSPILYPTKYVVNMEIFAHIKTFHEIATRVENYDNFLQKSMRLWHENGMMFDRENYLINYVLDFLYIMMEGRIPHIKHTALYIILKIQTGLITIMAEKINRFYLSTNLEENMKLSKLTRIINDLALIISKHWNNYTPALSFLRIQCIQELTKWIKIYPEGFINEQYIKYIIGSMKPNYAVKVRIYALTVLPPIITEFLKRSHLTFNLSFLIKMVEDEKLEVAIAAVKAITKIYRKINFSRMNNNLIIQTIYTAKHYRLAQVCARFFVETVRDDSCVILEKLIFLDINQPELTQTKYPLLIESILDVLPTISNIKLYSCIFKTKQMNAAQRNHFLNFLTEVVQQIFTGHATFERVYSRKRPKTKKENIKAMCSDLVIFISTLIPHYPLTKLTPLILLVQKYGTTAIDLD